MPLIFVITLILFLANPGCTAPPPTPRDNAAAEREIRGKIAGIREAILAKSATDIVRPSTPDWTFTAPDGVVFDRASYLVRTEALFSRIIAIESLTTTVDRVTFVDPSTAEVEISQRMVRSERAPDTGLVSRLSLRYRERHLWALTNDGWRVRRVEFIGTPERVVLPVR